MARGLNAQQELFCLKYLELGTACDAFNAAYPVKEGSNRTLKSATECASRMMAEPKIRARIDELQAEVAAKLVDDKAYTLAKHMDDLDEVRAKARAVNDLTNLRAATVDKGKAAGLYTDKKDITITLRPDDARGIIAKLAAKYLK